MPRATLAEMDAEYSVPVTRPMERIGSATLPITIEHVDAEHLSSLLTVLDLTDQDLSQLLGVSRPTVWRWLTGKVEVPRMAVMVLELMLFIALRGDTNPQRKVLLPGEFFHVSLKE